MEPASPSTHRFKNVVLTDRNGRTFRLERAEVIAGDSKRRLVRIQMLAHQKGDPAAVTLFTLDFSRREAYAFSEWLDRVVTQPRLD
jgi:hypothetical protein